MAGMDKLLKKIKDAADKGREDRPITTKLNTDIKLEQSPQI